MAANTNYTLVTDFVCKLFIERNCSKEQFARACEIDGELPADTWFGRLNGRGIFEKELFALVWSLLDKEQLISTLKELKSLQERVSELNKLATREAYKTVSDNYMERLNREFKEKLQRKREERQSSTTDK